MTTTQSTEKQHIQKLDLVRDKALELVNLMGTKELQVLNKDGKVCIDALTFNFTYIGEFGNYILRMILKNKVADDTGAKFAILAAGMIAYSSTVAGCNVMTINN
jgi:hypothetical protein